MTEGDKLNNLVRETTCFKYPYNPIWIGLVPTNCSRRFQEIQVTETDLSDFHKMKLTILKVYFTKKNMKPFSAGIKKALNIEITKHDVNNVDFGIFHEILLSILNAHAPLKMKHV